VESLFAELSAISLQERAPRLAAIADPEVRREVSSLLQHAGEGETVAAAVGGMIHHSSTVPQDQRFGPYRVIRRLGHGGQGAVFECVRDDGSFDQRVAIKVVKWEIDSDAARARFRQERQILAALQHPNIARLLDGGQREDGTPYLVMEFIEGQPLMAGTEGWSLRRRLEIFLEICSAVAFAHRNLIVHRDLKPANILVTAGGQSKLLDFGIAKLVDADSDRTLTAFQALTPDYASPEQVRGQPISIASDVYSLGVVLYELLTRRRPYKVSSTTPLEMDRVICQEPPAPAALGDELDHIISMALRKEPERRYRTIEQFAEDIQRYLDNRPVLARPDTLLYRSRKYVRRHWIGVLAASAALIGICGGAAVAVYQARIAQQRFQQVRKLAHSFVFDYHDALAKIEGTTAVRERMVSTALEYLDALSRGAGNDLDLQAELAAAYRKVGDTQGFPGRPNLGHVDQAIASFRKAAAIYDRVSAADPKRRGEVAEFYAAFTSLLSTAGDTAGAAKTGEIALHGAEEVAREKPDDESAQLAAARAWFLLGDIDDLTDHPQAEIEKYRKSETITRKALTRWHSEATLRIAEGTASRLGTAAIAVGHLSESLAAFDENTKILEELVKISPDGYRKSQGFLADSESQLYYDELFPNFEDPARAMPFSRRFAEITAAQVERDPNDSGAKFSHAAGLYRLAFDLTPTDPHAAVEVAQKSVRILDDEIAAGRKSYLVVTRHARALHYLSEALLAANQKDAARTAAAQTLAEERAIALKEEPKLQITTRVLMALVTCARIAETLGDRKDALTFLTEAQQDADKVHALDPAMMAYSIPVAHVWEALAEYWKWAGDAGQAQHWSAEVARLWREFPDQNEYVKRQLAKAR
jgi:tetratricopeptide (TPR) repeat protein/predicted Ser/Thr protein kinase